MAEEASTKPDFKKCPYDGQELIRLGAKNPEYPYRENYGPRWMCLECGAHVGCKSNGNPLGTAANAEDRQLRQKAHAAFDPFWRFARKPRAARSQEYAWLAREMGITPVSHCHIAWMHGDELKRVIEICEKRRESAERN